MKTEPGDYQNLRTNMVEGQLRTSDVTDHRILLAMLDVPRHLFVPASMRSLAYIDENIPVGPPGNESIRHLLAPMTFAKMLQSAEIRDTDLVLDIGCGTGYSAAVVAKIAESVVALEDQADFIEGASRRLTELDINNAVVVNGKLNDGYQNEGPYDIILIEGAVSAPPAKLLEQLRDGGRLVVIITRPNEVMGTAYLYRRIAGEVSRWPLFQAAAPLLDDFRQEAAFTF